MIVVDDYEFGGYSFEVESNGYIEYVEWDNIMDELGEENYEKFGTWMNGQTCIQEGVYPWDLERFVNNLID